MRIFEQARENTASSTSLHLGLGSLASSYQASGHQARFRTGHFDGKAN
jgi:hypothetical protein